MTEERKSTPPKERAYYDARLHEMLRWRRPHGSDTEKWWTKKFIVDPYEAWPICDPTRPDEVWAWVVSRTRPDGSLPKIMFSSHVDTVHRVEGRQKITYNIGTHSYGKNDGDPLGADDCAGVWLMLEMIDRNVPGVYVFHRGEERGGIGSSGIADEYHNFLEVFDAAIAFDRRSTYSVITWQGMGRCCSDTFGQALAEGLNNADEGFIYDIDDGGIFTDTANYTYHIPECTNVSVGYDDEHTPKESLYLPHLFALRDALPKVNWDALPIERDPKVRETWGSKYGGGRYGGVEVDFDMDPSWKHWTESRDKAKVSTLTHGTKKRSADELEYYKLTNMTRGEMQDLCFDEPELFVDIVRYELLGEIPRWADRDDEDDYYKHGYGS